MTKIKRCGLSRKEDIECANELKPDYIGFVFYKPSKRYVDRDKALNLKSILDPTIKTVGVFVDEDIDFVASLLKDEIIDIAQLHGNEDEQYIKDLKQISGKPVIKAIRISSADDIITANDSPADYILLDSGMGGGKVFDWGLLKDIKRDYFLAGGLTLDNVSNALETLKPYALDVSSGIETEGIKDTEKMIKFVKIVRDEMKNIRQDK